MLAALQALYHDPNPVAKKKANEWLEEFQHNVRLVVRGLIGGWLR